jgi:hypothetical protein
MQRNKTANPFTKLAVSQEVGNTHLGSVNCLGADWAVEDDGGKVLIDNVVVAAAPLRRLMGDAGLKAQEAPTIWLTSQASETALETLVCGVNVSTADPDCPAFMVTPGVARFNLKSGTFTWIETKALDDA